MTASGYAEPNCKKATRSSPRWPSMRRYQPSLRDATCTEQLCQRRLQRPVGGVVRFNHRRQLRRIRYSKKKGRVRTGCAEVKWGRGTPISMWRVSRSSRTNYPASLSTCSFGQPRRCTGTSHRFAAAGLLQDGRPLQKLQRISFAEVHDNLLSRQGNGSAIRAHINPGSIRFRLSRYEPR
jgi:hypothetical protein